MIVSVTDNNLLEEFFHQDLDAVMELFNVLNQRHNRLIRRWRRLGKKLGVPSLLCQHLQKDKNDTILVMFFDKLHDAKGVFMFLHFTHATRAVIAWITAFKQFSQSLVKNLKNKRKKAAEIRLSNISQHEKPPVKNILTTIHVFT